MSISYVVWNWYWYLIDTLWNNFIYKFIISIFWIFLIQIYQENLLLIKLMIFCYIVDFILWIIKAIRFKIYSSRVLFRWATKMIIYWVMMMTALAVDKSLWDVNIFLPFIIMFIILTDASSIFENLEELWYKTPPFIWKILQIHKNKLIAEKFKAFYWDDILINVHEDFKQMKTVYIPSIKKEEIRNMFEMKIQILEDFTVRIAEIKTDDLKTFKLQFDLILKLTWEKLNDVLHKANFKEKEVENFLSRHRIRAKMYVEEVENIFKEAKADEKVNTQFKNNIIQATVRVVYKWISDNINA